MSEAEETLYDRIGGEEGISRVVDAFYDRVMADEELKPFFAHSPPGRIRLMQRQFLAAAVGGPKPYHGQSLREAHRGRGITRRHLKLFLDHLTATLESIGVSEDDKRTLAARINLYADEVTEDRSSDPFNP